jgi:hypothetical protein
MNVPPPPIGLYEAFLLRVPGFQVKTSFQVIMDFSSGIQILVYVTFGR